MMIVILLTAGLTGCAAWPHDKITSLEYNERTAPVATSTANSDYQIASELMLLVLVGEMAAQAGDYQQASATLFEAAKQSTDPAVAERATRLALFARDYPLAMGAAQRWLDLDPVNKEVLRLAALLEINAGHIESATSRLQALTEFMDPEEDPRNIIALLVQAEHWETVLEMAEYWTRIYPGNSMSWYVHAEFALRSDSFKVASQVAREGLERFPAWVPLRLVLARSLIELNDADAGLEAFKAAVEANPERRDIRLAFARALVDLDDFSRAHPEFANLLRLAPDDSDLLLTIAVLSLEASEFNLARTYLLQLLQSGARSNDANYYLGRLKEEAGQLAEAREYYRNVGEGEHQHDALIRAARLTVELEGFSVAAREYGLLQADQNRDLALRAYFSEASQLRERGEALLSLQRLARGLLEFPESTQLLYLRGIVHEGLGDIPAAEADFRAILALDPENVSALNALGYTLADHTDRYDEAYDYILRAYDQRPDDAAIIDSYGWVLYRLGRFDEALIQLKRAYSLMPDGEIASNLAVVLWELGREEDSRQLIHDALHREPEHGRLLRVRSILFD